MAGYRERYVGNILEISVDDVVNKSIEDLIDQGKRFIVVKENEDEEEDATDVD